MNFISSYLRSSPKAAHKRKARKFKSETDFPKHFQASHTQDFHPNQPFMKDEANEIERLKTFNAKKTKSMHNESNKNHNEESEESDRNRSAAKLLNSVDDQHDSKSSTSGSNSTLDSHPIYSNDTSNSYSTTTTQRRTISPTSSPSSPPTSTTTSTSTSYSSSTSSNCPHHLNPHSIIIKNTQDAGRGLFASKPLKAGTLLEVSPVLTFPAQEYSSFGRFTRLDDYTFVWKKSSSGKHEMALALGLGSLFNHHPTSPNVSYSLSHSDDSIRYTLIRDVFEGQELCISYGAGRMWWDKQDDTKEKRREKALLEKERREANDAEAEWRKMAVISDSEEEEEVEEEETAKERAENAAVTQSPSKSTSIIKSTIPNDNQEDSKHQRSQKINSVLLPRDPSSSAAASTSTNSSIPRNPPLFRVTSALDPAEAPLILVNAWAIDVPPRLSNHVLQWIKVNAMALSRKARSSRSNHRGERGSNSEGSSNSNDTDSFEDDEDDEEDSESEEWNYDPDRGVKHLRAFKRSNSNERKNPEVLTALLCMESSGPDRETIVRLLRSRDDQTISDSNSNNQNDDNRDSIQVQEQDKTSTSTSTSMNDELEREMGKGKERMKIKPSNSLPTGYDPEPYLVSVPSAPAPSKARLLEWCSHWPVVIRHGIDPFSLTGGSNHQGSSVSGTSTPNGNGNCSPSSSSSSLPPINQHSFSGPSSIGLVDRAADSQSWTPNRILWAKESFKHVIELARIARENGQLPVAAHVTPSFNAGEDFSINSSSTSFSSSITTTKIDSTNQVTTSAKSTPKSSFCLPRSYLKSDAWDTRIKERNPIKHAVINVIKEVAEKRAEKDRTSNVWNGPVVFSDAVRGDYDAEPKKINKEIVSVNGTQSHSTSDDLEGNSNPENSNSSTIQSDSKSTLQESRSSSPNPQNSASDSNSIQTSNQPPSNSHPKDQDYLLTTLSLFVTHEPCAHCCMALVHSRVKAVYFLLPSPGSGGCCGANQIRPCIGGEDGGPYALQEERGLNHRFEVWRWVGGMKDLLSEEDLEDLKMEITKEKNENEKVEDEDGEFLARRKVKKLLETGGVDP